MRIHTSPSIQITEVDKSQYSPSMSGTKVYIQGFTSKGEVYKPIDITSRTAFTTIYGEPTTEAERYSYACVCEVLNNNGKVVFARLPYDNDSFEKVVGFKYNVSAKKTGLSQDARFSDVWAADNELDDYCEIEASGQPICYDLSSIDEYRTDEAKVKANTFLIVDTTGATYSKVTEDSRKGKDREVIGIVPIVTTAANALYAQSLIAPTLDKISCYEVVSGSALKTLSGTNDGLSATDFAQRLNTQGKWFYQKWRFQSVTMSVDSAEPCDISSCDGIISVLSEDGSKFYPTTVTLSAAVKHFNDCGGFFLSSTTRECFVDPESVTVSEDGGYTGLVIGPMPIDTSLPPSSLTSDAQFALEDAWHGVDGDDSIPTTLALDANSFFASIQPASDGVGFDPEHLKDIGVVVFKTYLDPSEGNKVSYEPVEAFCGSLYKDDKDPNTGVTKFIDTIINSQSEYINFFSNCFSSAATKKEYLEEVDILIAKPSECACLGLYSDMTKKYISVNKSIYDGMNKAHDKVRDINKLDIDIVPDAGLANIASFIKAIYGDKGEYDLTVTDDLGNSLLGMWKAKDPTNAAVKTWKTVEQKLDNFCKNVRKDCMFIADGLRPLVLQGQKKIIRDSKPTNTLDKDVLPYLKCIAGLNTSYGAGYMDWFEQADDYTGDFFWCPPSIKACGVYVNTDVNYNYWDAPAGLNRGVIPCTDVAFSPTAFQADLIYDKCWNYAINYPNDGIVLEGQKTLQTKPSALDRVNVRRLMLRLERAVGQSARWFLYEGNTAYTRQRLIDAIDPYFRQAKVGGGLYDYKLICDESVNTPETIDANELHLKCMIKPTKTIEYILVDFIVGSTGASWEEML